MKRRRVGGRIRTGTQRSAAMAVAFRSSSVGDPSFVLPSSRSDSRVALFGPDGEQARCESTRAAAAPRRRPRFERSPRCANHHGRLLRDKPAKPLQTRSRYPAGRDMGRRLWRRFADVTPLLSSHARGAWPVGPGHQPGDGRRTPANRGSAPAERPCPLDGRRGAPCHAPSVKPLPCCPARRPVRLPCTLGSSSGSAASQARQHAAEAPPPRRERSGCRATPARASSAGSSPRRPRLGRCSRFGKAGRRSGARRHSSARAVRSRRTAGAARA